MQKIPNPPYLWGTKMGRKVLKVQVWKPIQLLQEPNVDQLATGNRKMWIMASHFETLILFSYPVQQKTNTKKRPLVGVAKISSAVLICLANMVVWQTQQKRHLCLSTQKWNLYGSKFLSSVWRWYKKTPAICGSISTTLIWPIFHPGSIAFYPCLPLHHCSFYPCSITVDIPINSPF